MNDATKEPMDEASVSEAGDDAGDQVGLLPMALGFVPITLGGAASLLGFFVQDASRLHDFFVFALLAGAQMLCYVAGVVGLDVFSGGDACLRSARRIGVVLCLLCPLVLFLRHIAHLKWGILIEVPYWILSILFLWLVVRGLVVLRAGEESPWFEKWVRVTRWIAIPLVALPGSLIWVAILDAGFYRWVEWLFRPLALIPHTVRPEFLHMLLISFISTGLACFFALVLLLWYAHGDRSRVQRGMGMLEADTLLGTPLQPGGRGGIGASALWLGMFVAAIYLGGVLCGMIFMHNTNVMAEPHWRETLTSTVFALVGICVALWLVPGALFASALAGNVLGGVQRRLFHFLLMLVFVIVPFESCLLFTGVMFTASTRYPSHGYIREFAWLSGVVYPVAAALTTWVALRITRALLRPAAFSS